MATDTTKSNDGVVIDTSTSLDDVAIDTELVTLAHALRSRAESLRDESLTVDQVLAAAFRRRAAELELEAWVTEIQAGLPENELLELVS